MKLKIRPIQKNCQYLCYNTTTLADSKFKSENFR